MLGAWLCNLLGAQGLLESDRWAGVQWGPAGSRALHKAQGQGERGNECPSLTGRLFPADQGYGLSPPALFSPSFPPSFSTVKSLSGALQPRGLRKPRRRKAKFLCSGFPGGSVGLTRNHLSSRHDGGWGSASNWKRGN